MLIPALMVGQVIGNSVPTRPCPSSGSKERKTDSPEELRLKATGLNWTADALTRAADALERMITRVKSYCRDRRESK